MESSSRSLEESQDLTNFSLSRDHRSKSFQETTTQSTRPTPLLTKSKSMPMISRKCKAASCFTLRHRADAAPHAQQRARLARTQT
jgi:hypothetical protein